MTDPTDDVEGLFEEATNRTRARPGMGGVVVRSNPYEGGIEAEANWSDDVRIVTGRHETVGEALRELLDLLAEGLPPWPLDPKADNK